MEYTVYEADIDISQVTKNQDVLDKVFQSMTKQNMAEFAKKPGISTEVNSDEDNGGGEDGGDVESTAY